MGRSTELATTVSSIVAQRKNLCKLLASRAGVTGAAITVSALWNAGHRTATHDWSPPYSILRSRDPQHLPSPRADPPALWNLPPNNTPAPPPPSAAPFPSPLRLAQWAVTSRAPAQTPPSAVSLRPSPRTRGTAPPVRWCGPAQRGTTSA